MKRVSCGMSGKDGDSDGSVAASAWHGVMVWRVGCGVDLEHARHECRVFERAKASNMALNQWRLKSNQARSMASVTGAGRRAENIGIV